MNAAGGTSRVRVKICGITNQEDAHEAIALGADALGFNLYAGSKRFIELEREAEWIAALPPFVSRVAVLVNASLEETRRVAAHRAIDLVQLHGDEDESFCAEFARDGRPFIKALRLADVASAESAARFSTRHVLLDAHTRNAFGGTGALLDLALASECARRHPTLALILAGGLKVTNVAGAIRAVRPYAVDVASGVESGPRQKGRELMTAFIDAVHAEAREPSARV